MNVHYNCRECYAMHDPCVTCWVLIDEGNHPQQLMKQEEQDWEFCKDEVAYLAWLDDQLWIEQQQERKENEK